MYALFYLSQDIDEYLCQAKDKSYDTLVHFGKKGLNVAATAAVLAATKVLLTVNILFVLTWVYVGMECCFSGFHMLKMACCSQFDM